MFVFNCATPCRFLGKGESELNQIDSEKTRIENISISEQKPEELKTKNSPVTRCLLCDVEMSQARTKFKIEGLERSGQELSEDDSGQLEKEVLPVIVYLCPKCGKIEFKADEKLSKD